MPARCGPQDLLSRLRCFWHPNVPQWPSAAQLSPYWLNVHCPLSVSCNAFLWLFYVPYSHIVRRNCLLRQVIEGTVKGGVEVTGRRGRRRRKLLDDLKERRGYSHLKEEALDRTMLRARFGRGFGPVVRQTAEWMNSLDVPDLLAPVRPSRTSEYFVGVKRLVGF
jgi:hypothetical protein